MKVITYQVTLLEPALVTSLQGDPSSAVAFDYLPGSVLRGVWINKYLSSQAVDVSDSTLRRLFLGDATRYLNGYPLDVYNRPGLPVPASWQRIKHDESAIFDFAVEPLEDEEQWQPIQAPFYTRSGEDVRLILPARNVAVHTRRTPRFGRAMPEYLPARDGQARGELVKVLEKDEIVGAVFRYDALAAGQVFQAAIICDHDDDVSKLLPFIEGSVSLGRSRSGGYGQAEISQVQVHDHEPEWDAPEENEDVPAGKLIVTLRSDVLVRDARGQFVVDARCLGKVLSRLLHLEELVLEDAFLDTRLVGGFNRKWRLPIPQALAIRMGSVLIFQDPGCNLEAQAVLEARGIGERRAEGFGRIAFNRQRVAEFKVEKNTRSAQEPAITISEEPANKLAREMVARMLRQRLDEELLAAATSERIINPPSNAQISRLRSVVLEQLYQEKPDLSKICQFLKNIEERSSARRQFALSRFKNMNTPLLKWLKEWLQCDHTGAWTMRDKHHEWKTLLHLNASKIESLEIGGVKASIDDDLRLEYVLRFIDLVLAHAAKDRGKEN